MRILITGAGGYIGSALTHYLTMLGHAITAMTTEKKGYAHIHPRATTSTITLDNREQLIDWVNATQPEAVIHAAAYNDRIESMHDTTKYSRNITSTINLLDAILHTKCEIFIYLSTITVHGSYGGTINEESPVAPACYYAQTKYIGELISTWYGKQHDITVSIARLTNIIGDLNGYVHTSPQNLIHKIIHEYRRGNTTFTLRTGYKTPDGTIRRDYLDIHDACIVINQMLHSKGGVYTIGSGKSHSVKQILTYVQKHLGRLTIRKVKHEPCAWIPPTRTIDIRKARKELYFNPRVTIEESIQQMIKGGRGA